MRQSERSTTGDAIALVWNQRNARLNNDNDESLVREVTPPRPSSIHFGCFSDGPFAFLAREPICLELRPDRHAGYSIMPAYMCARLHHPHSMFYWLGGLMEYSNKCFIVNRKNQTFY